MTHTELIENINKLKKERDAIILVHNYQRPEIYDVADHIGDSLDLARKAARAKEKIIVFAGVRFMAETAKILCPEKTVLLPALHAKCPLAGAATPAQVIQARKEHPDAAVVSYVNTSASVKAESDYCCTSMNAVKLINSIPEKEVIFLPDRNLGLYARKNSGKKIHIWSGSCFVHDNILPEDVKKARANHPEAKLMAHPECNPDVLSQADHVCGTGGMITYARENPAEEFIVATECGMCNRLKREVPGKTFYPFGTVCFRMKDTTLEGVQKALTNGQYEVSLPQDIMMRARKALDAMLGF
ncbi:MAG: quinolinate synthase NadA [archaeon]